MHLLPLLEIAFGIFHAYTGIKTYLLQFFPERAEEINELVNPGEYGVESYYCRWLGCNLLILTVMSDSYCTVKETYLNIKVPTVMSDFYCTVE